MQTLTCRRQSRNAPLRKSLFLICLLVLSILFCKCSVSIAHSGHSAFPERIISLGPINTENVYLLGAGDRLVGTTSYCVRPEAAKATEKIGSVMQVSVEKIISLTPDLVLATGLTSASQVALLRDVGLKVVRFDQPASFAASCAQFAQLGRLLGLENRAKAIIADSRRQIKVMVDRLVELGLPPQKVLMQIGADPLYASGRDSFTNDFIELLGSENAMGDRPSGRVNYEQVIAVNPDVILIGIMGSETGIAAVEQKKWHRIPVLKAVQDNRVHVLDPDMVCSPSPATFVETLKVILPLIYPKTAEMSKITKMEKGNEQ